MKASSIFVLCAAGLLLAGCGQHGFTVTTDSASQGRFHQPQFASTDGCTGANASPQLSWSGAPKDTASFAVTMFDPDAKTDHGGFWHWVAANLPAGTNVLPENAANTPANWPQGALQVQNDFGYGGYGGPCPPSGEEHHYVITVYALKTPALLIPATATPRQAADEIRKQAIAHAQITVRAGS